MSGASDLVAAVQALVAGVSAAAFDPAERIRLLLGVIAVEPLAGGDPALVAVGRRAALVDLARAAAEYAPRSYDDAVGVRSTVCALLVDEEVLAADAGADDLAASLRSLRGAVYRDLTRRGASLSPLRDVRVAAGLPAEALAQRLYGDARRADELVSMAGDPPNPVFMPGQFRALGR